MACRRFLRDLERSKDPAYPWHFDEEKAARPCNFIERFLSPTKGDYDRMELMPWQCFVECNLYGWVDKETGLRRYREGLIVVGTGNGKSTMLAGNATYGACKDNERGADIYLLANSKRRLCGADGCAECRGGRQRDDRYGAADRRAVRRQRRQRPALRIAL